MFSSRKTGSASNAYNLTNSLRFRSSASAYLNRTPASAGNRQKWTWSAWVKLGTIDASNGTLFNAGTTSGEGTRFYLRYTGSSLQTGYGSANYFSTSNLLRDPSAWYHIVCAYDSTQATASNRILLYINGVLATYTFGTNVTQNVNGAVNNNVSHQIASDQIIPGGYFDGYMDEINFIDGQALTPSSFGATSAATGVWQPIKYTGTYGTNGFYLPFTNTSSTSTLGNDFSGNSNTWTVNNISLTAGSTYDSMTDVPTLTSATTANYCTLNPLNSFGSAATISNGNLNIVTPSANGGTTLSTMAVSSGKWYWEVALVTQATFVQIGIVSVTATLAAYLESMSTALYFISGNKGTGPSGVNVAYGSTVANGDNVGVALDMDAGTLTFYKNGVSMGTAFTGISGTYTPGFGDSANTISTTFSVNFGQQPFAYTPPTGFNRLNTFNLTTPTIGATASTQANKYFDATTYTGNNSTQSVTNSGSMQPDFVWVKNRTNAYTHLLYDVIRGVGTLKAISSSETTAEGGMSDNATFGYLSALNSNGFTVVSGSTANSYTNSSSNNYVGWQWKANGSGSTNTAGSITSTVSANTSAGFSIVTYTGTGANATVGHGLGVAPSFIIAKARNSAQRWTVYTAALGNGYYGYLNETFAFDTANASLRWNTAPTSSVFGVGTSVDVNGNTTTYVAYCFAQVAGYSAFGSYTGNGSTDGPFVFTGFRPRFVLVKESSAAGNNWVIYDTARDTYNECSKILYPNLSNAEFDGSTVNLDILSNGFKPRDNWGGNNNSGSTYIYMAFAESPFKFSNAR